jgi:hypothetical protein
MSIPPAGERPLASAMATVSRPSAALRAPAELASASTVSADRPSPFAQLMRGLGHEVQASETLVHQAIASANGGELGPAQLIALQAGVYRYSEAVDLASRLIDHATTGLKTVVQGQ